MTNNNTPAAPAAVRLPARFPNTTTARNRLVEGGFVTREQADALQGKALKAAWDDARALQAMEPEPEAPVKPAKPVAKGKKAPVKPAPAAKPAPSFPLCGCGCGVPTITAKARFLPGHDARFAGRVGRGEIKPTEAQQALITPALQKKIDGIAATARKKEAAKAARAAARAAAAKAYAEALKA